MITAIPQLAALRTIPIIGSIVAWLDSHATLTGEISPSFEVMVAFEQQQGALEFKEGTGSLGCDLKATLQVNIVPQLSAKAWVGGGGSFTLGVPVTATNPLLRQGELHFQAGAELKASYIFEYTARATFDAGCTYTSAARRGLRERRLDVERHGLAGARIRRGHRAALRAIRKGLRVPKRPADPPGEPADAEVGHGDDPRRQRLPGRLAEDPSGGNGQAPALGPPGHRPSRSCSPPRSPGPSTAARVGARRPWSPPTRGPSSIPSPASTPTGKSSRPGSGSRTPPSRPPSRRPRSCPSSTRVSRSSARSSTRRRRPGGPSPR